MNTTVVFIILYVLNISVYVLPDDTGWAPKHVEVIQKLYFYVYYMCKSFFLEKLE